MMDEKSIESEANEPAEKLTKQIPGGKGAPVLQALKGSNAHRPDVG